VFRVDPMVHDRGHFLCDPAHRATIPPVAASGRGRDGVRGAQGGGAREQRSDRAGKEPERARAYVSRGGLKLEHALQRCRLDVAGRRALDVGASTGGFTDCLLAHGAREVVAVDVGYGQFDWRLRNDPRVHVLERTNARGLLPEMLPFTADLAVIDASFISIAKLLPAVLACLAPSHDVLALVKPQFEVGRERVGKGGVVRVAEHRRDALVAVGAAALEAGEGIAGYLPAGVTGPKGNRETFIWLVRGERGAGLALARDRAAVAELAAQAEPDENGAAAGR
jgi:23S rRNA (cytidine1920-2'-O)/16S rRNA (cytidine1409-2'-O)-methyltransferase